MSGQTRHLYTLGPFVLDADQRLLLRDGTPVPLAPKAVETLLLLVRNAGRLVEKDDLMKEVWPDAFVEEGNLTKNIFVLRQALGNGDRGREYIETVPTRGYRFVARVASVVSNSEGPATKTEPQQLAVATPALDPNALAGLHPAPELDGGRTERWPWRLTTTVLAVLVVAGLLGWAWLSPQPQPTVLKITQITHFGRVAATSRLVTDGARLYFVERRGGRYTLAEVPVEGGEPVPVPTPFPNTALYGISPDHSELLVGSSAGGEAEERLWMLPTTGGSPRRLGGVIGHEAAWSRDGRKIVYFSGSDLYVVKPDGSDSRKLLSAAGNGWLSCWSPDGQALRFTAWASELPTLSLWQVSAEGSNLHRLLAGWREAPTNHGDGESGGDWTPEGNYFVFRSTRAGKATIWAISEERKFLRQPSRAPVQLTTTDSSLWSLLAAKNRIFYTGDKEVRELARFDAWLKQFVPYLPGVRARDISFSRDGQWVAYIATTMQEAILWRSRADGRDRQQLTFPPMVAGAPRWSPDGKQIAFVGNLPGKLRRIFLVSSEGGEPEPVTALDSLYPDWSPGGDSLFFSAPVPASASMISAKNFGTYRLDLKTRQLSVFPGAEVLKASSWSPDGRYLVAQTRDDRKLMLFDSQSRQWSELAHGEVLRAPVLWSRDSKYAYSQDVSEGASQPIFRVRISNLKIERIATFEQILRADVRNYVLTGLAPDDSPLVSLVLSYSDIYALDLNLP